MELVRGVTASFPSSWSSSSTRRLRRQSRRRCSALECGASKSAINTCSSTVDQLSFTPRSPSRSAHHRWLPAETTSYHLPESNPLVRSFVGSVCVLINVGLGRGRRTAEAAQAGCVAGATSNALYYQLTRSSRTRLRRDLCRCWRGMVCHRCRLVEPSYRP